MKYVRFILVTMVLVISACSTPPESVLHLQGKTMGTTYNIKYVAQSTELSAQTVQKSIDEALVNVNKLMSTYDPTSELSRFNQSRFLEPFAISPQTHQVIAEAIRLGKLSDGVLDVTVGPLVNLWGFGPTKRPEKVLTAEQIEAIKPYVGLDKITLLPGAIRKNHPQVYVDLSTIAKGYGVDVVAELLESLGINDYLVEIGGEMRVKGNKHGGTPWVIAVEKPISTERAVQKTISIGDNAIASSGDYRNYYEQDGVRYSHLIDPRTGRPIQHNLVAVTVVHPSSMTADGLATAFNVMGWDHSIEVAEKHNIAVLLIRFVDGQFVEYTSEAFDELVQTYD